MARRFMKLRAGVLLLAIMLTFALGAPVPPRSQLRANEYTWHPETSPKGPVLVVISLPEQQAYVYRNGILIGRTTISSGRAGHRTPTGVFTVLEKQRRHYSNIYKGAAMPYMERLTWSGIALHGGKLPGYLDSHGCVRLPKEFSELLSGVTRVGTTVVVANESSDSALVTHPGPLMAMPARMKNLKLETLNGLDFRWHPERLTSGPTSIVISEADRQVVIFRNGEPIGRAHFELQGNYPFPTAVFSYLGRENGQNRWLGAGRDASETEKMLADLRSHVVVAPAFRDFVQSALQPGDTLCLVSFPVLPRSGAASPVE
jgi:L,D-transpeptidase catalytic domain